MPNVIFYKDKPNKFSCAVKIQGASLNESKARLVLSFSDKSVMYEGKITADGAVKIDLPPIKENYDGGKAVLEVIAESTFFEAWTSPFNLEVKRNVQVESVSVNNPKSSGVIVEDLNVETEKPKKKSLIRESVSSKDKKIIRDILEMYSPKMVKGYMPSNKKVQEWVKKSFYDPMSPKALFCGCVLENRLNKKKK